MWHVSRSHRATRGVDGAVDIGVLLAVAVGDRDASNLLPAYDMWSRPSAPGMAAEIVVIIEQEYARVFAYSLTIEVGRREP